MALIDLLMNGKVEEFNQTRGHRAPLDLFAADLSNLPLGGVDLSAANLQKADLSGSDLTDAVLAKSDLSGADLTGAVLKGAMAIRSKWKEAYCGGADMSEADFTGADLSEADLTKAKVAHAQFQGARLKGTVLEEADLSDCDFTEAKLSGSNLKGARLVGAILREAKLAHADLTGADLTKADLTQARISGATLRGAKLNGARLVSADLTACDLTGADVTEADFTRADLSEAVLDGVDMSTAVTTDVEQGGGTRDADPDDVSDKPELLHIDDPSVASLVGPSQATAFLWDNAEDAEKSRLRVVVASPETTFDGRAPALPIPSDLVLSSGIAAHDGGFACVALVERPGGVVASITTVASDGKLLATSSLKLGYTPAAKPVFRSEGGLLHIYGISREGPGVQVHRWEGGTELQQIHASRMPTARGFTSNRYPVLLTKGGIVAIVTSSGVGKPVRVPGSFPGRLCATCPIEGGGVAFAWLGREERGLRFAAGLPEQAPEEERLLPKQAIGVLDVNPAPEGAWVVFTQESNEATSPSTAWAVMLPGGKPFQVLDDEEADVMDVRFVGDGPVVAVSTLDGAVRGVRISPEGKWEQIWQIGE
jgi:uncharacterized protein YjbI with pentapeptide repeats